jgi:ADP-heptose:LPS heptosyltransferase
VDPKELPMLSAWRHARKLLCVRLDSAGDVLMTTPALRALKEVQPDRHVTLLTSPSGAAAARLVPVIDEIIEFNAPWMKPPKAEPAADRALINRLAAGGFDAAVVFTVYSQNPLPAAYLCYLAGLPRCLAHSRENPYGLLSDWVPETEPQQRVRHEVRRQLDLVAAVGATPRSESLSIAVPSIARRRAAAALGTLRVPRDGPLVVAHVGATAASRRYPPRRFAEALDLVVAEQRARVVLTGDASEVGLVETVRAAMRAPAYTLAGCLDFAELCAVIEAADVLVSNNTAPVHIAGAVGTPVVDLYALTNPQHMPWLVPNRVLSHDVPCRYCYKSVCPAGITIVSHASPRPRWRTPCARCSTRRSSPCTRRSPRCRPARSSGGLRPAYGRHRRGACSRSASMLRITIPPRVSCATATSSRRRRRSGSRASSTASGPCRSARGSCRITPSTIVSPPATSSWPTSITSLTRSIRISCSSAAPRR